MSAASEFAQLARLRPAEAIAYMDRRWRVAGTGHYSDLWQAQHEHAFTISRLTRADLLERVHGSLTEAVAGDLSRRDWLRQTQALLKKEGLWETVEVKDPITGEMLKTTFNEARLRLIHDTNVRQARAAGDWERMQRNQAIFPYARYVSMDDSRVRADHRAWHNTVLPVNHPWWSTHRPPNGYHCRCRVVALTQAQFDRGYSESRPGAEFEQPGAETKTGLNAPLVREPFKTEPPPTKLVDWRNPRTGEVQKIPKGIDPGFDYNPGNSGAAGKAVDALVQKKLAALSPSVRVAALAAGISPPKIAKQSPNQRNWEVLGLPDLRTMTPQGSTPALLEGAADALSALAALRETLDVPVDGIKLVQTPAGTVSIADRLLAHIVEKRKDERERFANFILPTLQQPDEVWSTKYDDDTTRRRFIKIFAGAKYDLLVIVVEQADGSVLWNMMPRRRKDLNDSRYGELAYRRGIEGTSGG